MSRSQSPQLQSNEKITDSIQLISLKLNILELGQRKLTENTSILGEENTKRADEIRILARQSGALVTEDDETSEKTACVPNDSDEDNDIPDANSPNSNPHMRYHATTANRNEASTLIPTKDLIRTIDVLNGRDDMGTHDFIKSIKRALVRSLQPKLLLDFIIAEKIVNQAKRAIRYSPINSYDDLYNTLKINLALTSSVELCRSRVEAFI